MPIDSASIGSNFSNYQGNAQLGGAQGEAFKIDMHPLDMLAAYTNLQNKQFWEQTQKNVDTMVSEFSRITPLDANLLYGGDRDKIIEARSKVIKDVTNSLQNPPSDPAQYGKWIADGFLKIDQFAGDYETKKQRTISRAAQIKTAQDTYANDPKELAAALKQIDDNFNSTEGKLESVPFWTATTIPHAKPQTTDLEVYNIGKGDVNFKSVATLFNYPAVGSESNQISAFGKSLQSNYPPKTITDASGKETENPEYKTWVVGKSKEEIDFAAMQNLHPEQVKQVLGKGMEDIKAAISPYYVDGVFGEKQEEAFLEANAGNTILIGNYNNLKNMSMDAKRGKAALQPGGSYMNNGVEYKLPRSISSDFFDNGIINDYRKATPQQLIMADAYSRYEGDKVKTTETVTNKEQKRLDREAANWRQFLPYKYLTQAQKLEKEGKQKELTELVKNNGNIIYGVNSIKNAKNPNITLRKSDGTQVDNVTIVNGQLLDSKGNTIDYSGQLLLPASYFNNNIVSDYYKVYGAEVPHIYNRNGKYASLWKNGKIAGIQTFAGKSKDQENPDPGPYIGVDEYRKITQEAAKIRMGSKDYQDQQYGTQGNTAPPPPEDPDNLDI